MRQYWVYLKVRVWAVDERDALNRAMYDVSELVTRDDTSIDAVDRIEPELVR